MINGNHMMRNKFSILILILLIFNILMIIPQQRLATAESTAEASVNPVAGVEYIYSTPGETAEYKLQLRNNGNLRETFIIDIYSEMGWEISVNAPYTYGITLDSGEEKDIELSITIPNDVAAGQYWFDVIVKSKSEVAGESRVYAVVSSQGVVITASFRPVLIIEPSTEQLGAVRPGEYLEVDIRIRSYIDDAYVHLEYDLFKEVGAKLLPEKNISISLDPEKQYIEKGKSGVFRLTIRFSKEFKNKVDNTCRLRITANNEENNAISKSVRLYFLMFNRPDERRSENFLTHPITLTVLTTVLTLGAIGGALASSEAGKYRFLTLLFIPLYTKLHKDKILDHFTRGRVYEYIRNNPGAHYSEIRRELELNNGNLTYHLHTLEREALIKSRTKGRFKVFYIMDVKVPLDMEPHISSFRVQLLDIIREHPGITQKGLGSMLSNKKQRTISYHIKTLSREGVIRLEKVGRETKCYITQDVIDIKPGLEHGHGGDGTEEYSSNKYLDKDSILRQI